MYGCLQRALYYANITFDRAVVDDEYYEEWSFEPDDNLPDDADEAATGPSKIIYLNSLHLGSPHPQHDAAPPVLRDLRGTVERYVCLAIWGNADTRIRVSSAENQELSVVLSSKPGAGVYM